MQDNSLCAAQAPGAVALIVPGPGRGQIWAERLAPHLPGWRVAALEDLDKARDPIAYAVVWQPPAGVLASLPGLRAVVSLGAGIDHVLADPLLPQHLPILRTTGPDLTQRMQEYVALQVLALHRAAPSMARAQARQAWEQPLVPPATRRQVGVLGLGNLGAAAAGLLAQIGFRTRGWARGPKTIAGVECFAGPEGLAPFLAGCEILVNLLPLTPQTAGILNRGLFAQLAPGAGVINAARGGHLVEADLIPALEAGLLSQAVLDVFTTEPLPQDHAFWRHPQITVTPHVASMIDPDSGVRLVAANIRAHAATGLPEDPRDLADATRGY